MAIMEDEKKTEAAPVPDTGSGKSSIIKWAIIGVIELMFIGIMVAIAITTANYIKGKDKSVDSEKQAEEERKREELKSKEMGATLKDPIEITVNIIGEEGGFVKCKVQLEYDSKDIKLGEELENRKARIKDIIIDIMSSRTRSELMTNDGKQAIKEQIVKDINNMLPETVDGKPLGTIRRSYFDEILLQ